MRWAPVRIVLNPIYIKQQNGSNIFLPHSICFKIRKQKPMIIFKKPVFPLSKYVQVIIIYESLPTLAKKDISSSVVDGCPVMLFHSKEPLKFKNSNNGWISHPQQCLMDKKKL